MDVFQTEGKIPEEIDKYNLVVARKVLADGSEVPLQFVFESDYKVITDL